MLGRQDDRELLLVCNIGVDQSASDSKDTVIVEEWIVGTKGSRFWLNVSS